LNERKGAIQNVYFMKFTREDYNRRIVDLENRIPENEPVFLLRGQDKFASLTLKKYCEFLEEEA